MSDRRLVSVVANDMRLEFWIGRVGVVVHYGAWWVDFKAGHYGECFSARFPKGVPEFAIGPFQVFY